MKKYKFLYRSVLALFCLLIVIVSCQKDKQTETLDNKSVEKKTETTSESYKSILEQSTEKISKLRDENCIRECQQRLRDKVEICDDLVQSPGSVYYHDTQWHKTCLANARTEFDNCLSLCK